MHELIGKGDVSLSEGTPVFRNPVSILDIYRGKVPVQQRFAAEEVESFYHALGSWDLLFHVRDFGDTQKITIVCPPLYGRELQQVFHFAAPSKVFGVDYYDTQTDWDALYSQDFNRNRLAAHRQIPQWAIFEQYRESLRRFIGEDKEDAPQRERVTPVIRVNKKRDSYRWVLDPITDNQREIISQQTEHRLGELIPALGPVFVKAFSPDIEWASRLNYKMESGGATQDMGSTQAFALSLAKADGLFSGGLLPHLLAYAETGEISQDPIQQ